MFKLFAVFKVYSTTALIKIRPLAAGCVHSIPYKMGASEKPCPHRTYLRVLASQEPFLHAKFLVFCGELIVFDEGYRTQAFRGQA